MDQNSANVKRTENVLRYIESAGLVITVTVKNEILTIKIINPTEHELLTYTQIDITSDIPCNNEDVQQKYIITTELYNDLLGDEKSERKLNARKTRYARDSDWWKYNSYYMYPGEKL